MKRTFFVITFSLALLVGSANPTAEHSINPRSPAGRIEIFPEGKTSARPYREIGLLTDDGGLGEQGEIEQKFLKKARQMSGDAIILQPLLKSGGELQGFSWVETYLYKASVISFE